MQGHASSRTRREPTAAPWAPTPPPQPAETQPPGCRACTVRVEARMGTCPGLMHAASFAAEQGDRLEIVPLH
eukprot:8612659-Prorocentrum_lima.AAC.1